MIDAHSGLPFLITTSPPSGSQETLAVHLLLVLDGPRKLARPGSVAPCGLSPLFGEQPGHPACGKFGGEGHVQRAAFGVGAHDAVF